MAAYHKTVKDCKRIQYGTTFLLQIVYLLFLVYATITSTGITHIINGALCLLSAAYFLFFALITKCGKDMDAQKKGRTAKKLLTCCKRLAKLYTLGVMIFGVFQTVKSITPFSVVLAVLMVVFFILQIIFDVLVYIVEQRLSLFVSAIMHDIRPITETKRNVGNFFKRLTGKETEPEPIVTELDEKNLSILEPLVEKDFQSRREQEELKKQEKIRQKEEEKETKRAKKLAKRAAKKQKAPPAADEEIAAAKKQ